MSGDVYTSCLCHAGMLSHATLALVRGRVERADSAVFAKVRVLFSAMPTMDTDVDSEFSGLAAVKLRVAALMVASGGTPMLVKSSPMSLGESSSVPNLRSLLSRYMYWAPS